MILVFVGSLLISLSNLLWGGNEDVNVIVVLETSMGNIEIKLATEEAPITTENFLSYVEDDFYAGTARANDIRYVQIPIRIRGYSDYARAPGCC